MTGQDTASIIESILKQLLAHLGFPNAGIAKDSVAGQVIYSIEAGEAGRILTGQYGDAVHALDFIVKKMVEKQLPPAEGEHEPLFLIDVNGYRTQKIKDLQAKALMMADRAKSLQYDVELSPMSAYERLIVHTTLQDIPHVKTESQGEGRNRRVVIKYAA
jgi:spoIIIJ-associated protein